jgi:hypothetical protein
MNEVTLAEFAMARQRHILGLGTCGIEFNDHVWSSLYDEPSDQTLAVLCRDCGILPIELLMEQPISDPLDA